MPALWVAAGSALVGAYSAYSGASKNADAIERGAQIGSDIQRDALNTSIALARPQLEVGNSALGVLASLYGLQPPSALNFDGPGGIGGQGSGFAGVDFDPDRPMTAAQVTQAYRAVFGRDPDPQGLQFHLTRGPREGAGGLGRTFNKIHTKTSRDLFGVNDDTPDRRAFTFNEFLQAAQGSDEYLDKKERGILPPTVEGGQYSANFSGNEIKDPKARALFFQQQEQAQQDAQPAAAGLDLNELVANNPLIQFNRQQGEQAIDRGAAARGLNQSGGTLKDLATFNQDLSGAGVQQFVLNPLFQLAGFGPQASGQVNQAVQNTGNNLSNIALGAADARGSAYQSGYNAFGTAISDFGGAALNNFGRQSSALPNNSLTNAQGTGSIDGLVSPNSPYYVPGRD